MTSLETDPLIQRDLLEVRRFIQAQEVLQAMNLAKTLRQENPQERSLDDPSKLTDALNKVQSDLSKRTDLKWKKSFFVRENGRNFLNFMTPWFFKSGLL